MVLDSCLDLWWSMFFFLIPFELLKDLIFKKSFFPWKGDDHISKCGIGNRNTKNTFILGHEGIWLHFFKHLNLGDLIFHLNVKRTGIAMEFVKAVFEDFVRASWSPVEIPVDLFLFVWNLYISLWAQLRTAVDHHVWAQITIINIMQEQQSNDPLAACSVFINFLQCCKHSSLICWLVDRDHCW